MMYLNNYDQGNIFHFLKIKMSRGFEFAHQKIIIKKKTKT